MRGNYEPLSTAISFKPFPATLVPRPQPSYANQRMMTFGFMLTAIAFIVVLTVMLAKVYLTDTRRMTSYTNGTVVSAEQRVVVTDNERRTETEITARFTAAGHEVELKRVVRGERAKHFPPGAPIPVRYNPGRPWMAQINI